MCSVQEKWKQRDGENNNNNKSELGLGLLTRAFQEVTSDGV